jgi:ATP-dependent helicase STH1/SNF2
MNLGDFIDDKISNNKELILKIGNSLPDPVPEQITKFNEEEADKRKITELRELLEFDGLDEKLRSESKIMLRMLELKPLQAKIRNRVLKRYRDGNLPPEVGYRDAEAAFKVLTVGDKIYESTLVDRHFYKRPRIYATQNKKEGKIIERFEQQMRNGQENQKKARHKEFLNKILAHAKNFSEFHKKKVKKLKRFAFETRNKLNQIEKKEQQAKDKEEKERLRALKENKFEEYLDLIKKEKNSRLLEILEQTNHYLERLGAKVKVQKQMTAAAKGVVEEDEINDDEEEKFEDEFLKGGIKDKLLRGSKIYYKVTHSIQEEIVDQPKMLTFGKLKSYQIIGLKWLVSLYNNNLNGILADEMGLGKTIQTISLFAYIIESKHNDGPFLVVVPLTTISNWEMEFEHWAPTMIIITYKGPPSVRAELAQRLKNEKFNVILTTYDYIMRDKAILSKIPWQYIVVDEGHRMKNSRSKFALTLGQQYSSANRLLLTGTPLQNDLSELWALLNFILPRIFESCEEFKNWFDKPLSKMHQTGNTKVSVDEKKAHDLTEEEQLLLINRLHQVLRPFLLRRVKKEVEKELPDKIEIVVKVELSAWQKISYRQIQDYGFLGLDDNGKKVALQNTVMQLRKICNHPYQFFDFFSENHYLGDNLFRTSGKFELLDRMLPKLMITNHKVLIFSQFTHLMNILQ